MTSLGKTQLANRLNAYGCIRDTSRENFEQAVLLSSHA